MGVSIPLKSGLIVIEYWIDEEDLEIFVSIPLKSGLIVMHTIHPRLCKGYVSIPLKSGLIVIGLIDGEPYFVASLNPLEIGSNCNFKLDFPKMKTIGGVSIPLKSGLIVIP